ncbi:MAG: discoidin domain-containing protein [Phycisphaerae bacterium]|nr:discoidin domain-containing protein [Phycisphaerae bacterium]
MTRKQAMIAALVLVWCVGTAQADLVGLWTMDEGQGSVTKDISGNGNDGTFEGGPVWIAGKYGSGLELDGSSSVNCGDAPQLELSGGMTLMCWVNPSDLTGDRGFLARNASYAMKSSGTSLRFTTPGVLDHTGTNTTLTMGVWQHVAVSFNPGQTGGAVFYLNGVETNRMNASAINAGSGPVEIGHNQWGQFYIGQIDDVAAFNHIMTAEEIQEAMLGLGHVELAVNPDPEDAADDVLRDAVLSWGPGAYAATHNVYVGTSLEEVDSATVPTASGLSDSAFDAGRLDFGQTYFWRVDEVNGTPDKTVFKGKVWSFTVEPYSIQIPVAADNVTASTSTPINLPGLTVDGSGLTGSAHSTSSDQMWLSASGDLDPWLMYEFDKVQKLDQMLIWNANSPSEGFIGWGLKDVNIETSIDGVAWTALAESPQISRAPGAATYDTPQVIDFGLAQAKYVRLNILSNWGGILKQYGVSEVQFYGLPVEARQPDPASGAVDVLPNATVAWRAGREADQHTVYVSADQNAVADGLAPSDSSTTNSLDLSGFGLDLGETYYWRVDEVNDAVVPSVWAGPVWSFSTAEAVVVDDFESYDNLSPNRPFQTWLDGYGYSADEFFPVTYGGNGTGAGIGHDIWGPSSPYFNLDLMETASTIPGSGQSMPFYYSNTGGTASQTDRTFATPQDWTVGGVKTLSIAFRGQTGNTGTLYVMVNNTKVPYDNDAGDIALSAWQAWNIDLSSLGINLQSVTKLSIGVDGSGAAGMLLIDDIKLHPGVGELITPADPGTDNLVSLYNLDGDFRDSKGSHHGAALGSPQFVSDPEKGQVMFLDGASNAVDVPYSAQLNPETVTASLWVNAEASGTGHRSPLTSRDDGPARGYILYAEPGNTWQFWIGTGTGWAAVQGPAVNTDEWTHLTASYADGQMRFYVNGFLAGEGANTIGLNTAQPLRIGGGATEGPGNYFFVGMIDEVRIYNRELSAGEALWLSGRTTPIDKPF